jgi:PAS domain S-box-containing protein
MDAFVRLFDPVGFPPRWQCGPGWAESPWVGWMHVVSDIGIWSAYFAIPLVLASFIVRRKDLPFRRIFVLFAAFILLCGLTHLVDASIFWWPIYRFSAVLKLFTAAVSWGTVLALFPIVPQVLSLRSPRELEQEIDRRRVAEEQLQEANAELERRVQERTAELSQAIEQLSSERELLQITLRSIGDGVIVSDEQGRVTFINSVAEKLTEWTSEQAAGEDLVKVFHIVNESSRQPVENPALRALRDGTIVGLANHTVLISREGTERAIDDSAAPIRVRDTIAGAVLVFRDITDRKAAEAELELSHELLTLSNQALQQSESRLQLAIAIGQMGTFEIDLLSDRVSVNDQGRLIYGWEPAEELTFTKVQSHFHEEDKADAIAQVEAAIAPTGCNEFEIEQRIRRVDGQLRWIRVRGKAIFEGEAESRRAVRCVGTYLDVTDRKRSDDSLRYQLDLTTAITDNATTAIFMLDWRSRCTFMNPAAEAMIGFKFAEVEGKILHDVIHHHHADGSVFTIDRCPLHRALPEHLEVRDHEDIFIRRSGEFFPVLCNARVVYKSEIAVGTVLEVRDITEQKLAEERLRASETRFREIADAMPQIVWATLADGHHEYFNRRWYEYTGTKPGEAEGDGWADYFHPDDRDPARERWQQSVDTGDAYEIQYRLRNHAGNYRWFLGRALPVRNQHGAVTKWFGTCTDIEAYKQLEADRHKFVSLVENSTDFIAAWDLAGNTLYLNQAGIRMVGLDSFDDALKLRASDFFFAEDRTLIEEKVFPQVLRRGHAEIEIRFRHFKSDAPMWMLYHVFVLTDNNGEQVGLATVTRDVTQRRQLENDLRRLAADLSEAARRKDEFLATLAHELRNPLAPIRNGLQILKIAQHSGHAIDQARTMMERQLGQMVRLVDDLLDVSRITRNKLELRKENVLLGDVIDDAVVTSRSLIDANRHELTVKLPDKPVLLDADPTRLAQVFANLLNNAARYTPPGGRIDITATVEGDQVVVHVADTGIGIPEDMLAIVFDMFTQVDRSLERSQGGLGIGLTLVRRLVEMHDGEVEAHSDGEGRGSLFIVRLPMLVIDADTSANHQLEQEVATPASVRILVADDNVDAANTLAMMLRLLGNDVRAVHDGQQAVDAAAEMSPDLILLDIGMPKLTGYEAATAIRKLTLRKRPVLAALTGWGQEEDRRRSQAAGFDHHLVKPVDPAELQRLLASVSAV